MAGKSLGKSWEIRGWKLNISEAGGIGRVVRIFSSWPAVLSSSLGYVERCDIMPAMSETMNPGMVPDEMKFEPKSKGLTTPRKKKPKELAVITECCTGCAGSPACVEYCPVQDCMFWVPDEDHPPFGRIQVDPILCIGCKKCLSKGPDGCFLDGCPWDAIVMVDTPEVELEVGVMPF
jgi:ferredoxin